MSASNNPTLQPTCFKAKARFVAKVDLPTPPFALDIAIVYLVPKIGFFSNFFIFWVNYAFINTNNLSLSNIGEYLLTCSL